MPRKAISTFLFTALGLSLMLAGGCYRNNGCQIDPYPDSRHHGPGPALGRPTKDLSGGYYSRPRTSPPNQTESVNRTYQGTYYGPVEDEVIIESSRPVKKKATAAKSSANINRKSVKKSKATAKSATVKKSATSKSRAVAKKSSSSGKSGSSGKSLKTKSTYNGSNEQTYAPVQPAVKTAGGSQSAGAVQKSGSNYRSASPAATNCNPCQYKPVKPRREPWPGVNQSKQVQPVIANGCSPCEGF